MIDYNSVGEMTSAKLWALGASFDRLPYDSVKEKSLAREQHRHVVLVGCVNRLLIPDRAPRLNHRGDPYIVRCIDAISEREECV